MDIIVRAPFDGSRLATASSGGITLYQCDDDKLNVIDSLHRQKMSLSLDWMLHKLLVKCILLLP